MPPADAARQYPERMTTSRLRLTLSAFALVGSALLVAGCASSPSSSPPTTPAGQVGQSAEPEPDDADADDVDVAWLDDGRGIAVVTIGSSTCLPAVSAVEADGQHVTVTLADGEPAQPCTRDLVPRAVFVAMPDGVDVTEELLVTVGYGERTDDVELDALAVAAQGPSEQKSSAGWLDDDSIALLTWGSSTCRPVLADLDQTPTGATATFTTVDGVCTADMAPRVTIIDLPNEHEDGPFELVLVGDNLDATLTVTG